MDLAGAKTYVLPGGSTQRVISTLGFCDDCGNFRAVEDFDVDKARRKVVDAMREYDSRVKARDRLRASFWSRFWFKRYDVKNAEGFVKLTASYIPPLEAHLALCEARQGTPRCLECGSYRVSTVIVPFSNELGDGEERLMPLSHLGCPGPIRVRKSGLRMSPRARAERFYSLDGQELFEEDQ